MEIRASLSGRALKSADENVDVFKPIYILDVWSCLIPSIEKNEAPSGCVFKCGQL